MATRTRSHRREVPLLHPPERTTVEDLRRAGRELDLNHPQLATLLGVSLATVDHWLSGRTVVPLPITLAIQTLSHRDRNRRLMARVRKRARLLAQSLELRPPVKQKFF